MPMPPALECCWSKDGGWYEICSTSSDVVTPQRGVPYLQVVYLDEHGDPSKDHDAIEMQEVERRLRIASRQVQDADCTHVDVGSRVSVLHETEYASRFLDATVVNKQSQPHQIDVEGNEECCCMFRVLWSDPPVSTDTSDPPYPWTTTGIGRICSRATTPVAQHVVVAKWLEQMRRISATRLHRRRSFLTGRRTRLRQTEETASPQQRLWSALLDICAKVELQPSAAEVPNAPSPSCTSRCAVAGCRCKRVRIEGLSLSSHERQSLIGAQLKANIILAPPTRQQLNADA